jgi:thiol-disulfide isomerase/thioredoxin
LSFDVQEQLKENPEVTLLVEFYTVWSPPCKKLAEPFAEVSLRYKKNP